MKACFALVLALVALPAVAASGPYEASGPLGARTGPPPACVFAKPASAGEEPPCVPARAPPGAPQRERVANALARADGFLLANRPEDVRRSVEEALTIDPQDARAWHHLARLRLSDGAWADARTAMDRSLELDGRDAGAIATGAYITAMAGRTREAVAQFGQALAIDAGNVFALTNRVELLRQLGDGPGVERDLDALQRLRPNHPTAVTRRLAGAAQADDAGRMLAEIGHALARNPGSLDLLVKRARLLQATGEHRMAEDAYATILGDRTASPRFALGNPQAAQLHLHRAMNLHALRRHEEARASVERAVALADESVLLKMQVWLRNAGFDDVEVTGTRGRAFEQALANCMLNPACGTGVIQRI